MPVPTPFAFNRVAKVRRPECELVRIRALLFLNRRTRRFFLFIKCIFADAKYKGQTAAAIAKTGTWKLVIAARFKFRRA